MIRLGENPQECRLISVTDQLAIYRKEHDEMLKNPAGWGPDIIALDEKIAGLEKERDMLLKQTIKHGESQPLVTKRDIKTGESYYGKYNKIQAPPIPDIQDVYQVCKTPSCPGEHTFITYTEPFGVMVLCKYAGAFYMKVDKDGRYVDPSVKEGEGVKPEKVRAVTPA